MPTLELEAGYPDEATARAVMGALDPDNAGYVESELRGSSIIFRMSSDSAGTLRSTADDLMACLKAAEEACGAAGGRLVPSEGSDPVLLAAERGDAGAQYEIGERYRLGTGVEASEEEAARWYRLAADQGHADAQYRLGCHLEGMYTDASTEEAERWYRLAADQGHADAMYRLWWVCSDDEESDKWRRSAAELGSLEAQYDLYKHYLRSRVDRSYDEAVRWCRRAADQGGAGAQCILGHIYQDGVIIGQSFEEAARWYRLAADQGARDAQASLGTLYLYGAGVEQSFKEAARLYRLAAEGWKYVPNEALIRLARLCEQGLGVEQSYEEAARLYGELVRWDPSYHHKTAYASFRLGMLYEQGLGVEQSYEEAARLYQLITQLDKSRDFRDSHREYPYHSPEPDYAIRLGMLYEQGLGVERSYGEALRWYMIAAETGSADALLAIGRLYEQGLGVRRSEDAAAGFRRLAATKSAPWVGEDSLEVSAERTDARASGFR